MTSDDSRDKLERTAALASDSELRKALQSLSRLATGRLTLEDSLTQIASYAVRAIPGAEGAGLTMLEKGQADTIVSTAAFVTDIDDIQYGVGQGPCITAAREGHTVLSGGLGGDGRWPLFGARAAKLGVHSALSLPLITPDGVVGAMNIYARAAAAFDDRAARLGELFALPAAIAVQNAQVVDQARRLAGQLQTALSSRAAVDRAVGIIMSRSGNSAEDALNELRIMSQRQHEQLQVVAEKLVDRAVRRAQALTTGF